MTRKLLHRTLQLAYETGVDTNERLQALGGTLGRIEDSVNDAKKGAQDAEFALMRKMSGLQSEMLNGVQKVLADQTRNAECKHKIFNGGIVYLC
jgi:hypothetical protein